MDYQELINSLLPGKTLKDKYERLEKAAKKVKKPKKIPFDHSDIYDKKAFKEAFSDWPSAKLKHYYESADTYSEEGNLYVNWEKAIRNWASRDDLQGKYKWPSQVSETNQINGLIM